jgi:hypothetical protein
MTRKQRKGLRRIKRIRQESARELQVVPGNGAQGRDADGVVLACEEPIAERTVGADEPKAEQFVPMRLDRTSLFDALHHALEVVVPLTRVVAEGSENGRALEPRQPYRCIKSKGSDDGSARDVYDCLSRPCGFPRVLEQRRAGIGVQWVTRALRE